MFGSVYFGSAPISAIEFIYFTPSTQELTGKAFIYRCSTPTEQTITGNYYLAARRKFGLQAKARIQRTADRHISGKYHVELLPVKTC